MTKIVISGYYGFANAGDEAMLTAIVKALRSADRSARLTVISGAPQATAAKHGVTSVHRFNPLGIAAAISGCDLLLSGGGSLLQDFTSKKSLLYYLSVMLFAKLLGKKVMLFAQGIGPIRSAAMRRLTRFVCSRVDVITVRDAGSRQELVRMGIPEDKVQLTADAVLTLEPGNKEMGKALLARYKIPADRPLVAVSVRMWQEREAYFGELAQAVAHIAAAHKARLVLLPLQYPADLPACLKLRQLLPQNTEACVLDAAFDTEQFLALTGNFSLVIGMRLHALIFAAVMQVPFVAVSCDPKIDGFIAETGGLSAGTTETLRAADVEAAAAAAMARTDAAGRLQALRERAQLNEKMAFALLKKTHD